MSPKLVQIVFLAVSLLITAVFTTSTHGHALEPGFLEVHLIDTDTYSVLWKKPSDLGKPMAISAVLPDHCEQREPTDSVWDGTAYLSRWTTRCQGGLEGGTFQILGLDRTSTDVLVRYDFVDGTSQSKRLTQGESTFTIPKVPSRFEVVHTYLMLGFKHILEGIDHLIFILALLILVNGKRRLVITITAFTLAHSLTLTFATLGLVEIPGPPVEATIALSIMFVASEIINKQNDTQGLTERYPWLVAFTFGLLHGLGFAGALAQIGLPHSAIPTALLFFNIGVEFGQLFFITGVYLIIVPTKLLANRAHITKPIWLPKVTPYLIGSTAAFWTIQRVVNF